ncbi:Gfo/Idh/MocA family oxidoreductase [Arenibacter sp. GZD96]|uniref:Gfo/Idh/MocA family protein n=1 Tax=Aurantibrevibacter litoralis TaxID=3106030 RepID=UPI002AFF4BD0|nr:Gfo/Idh/MocA family oxidoreductase [Arenibacter sp. GZD-96]MEA1786278.1 Gfo/Idh/MocA family oxidoreductase [Arenibacter sp. GZD-96]
MKETIRWGIVGPGKIAQSFAKDLAFVPEGRLVAVASRSMERATAFAQEYGADKAYGSYEALFKSKEVDVVYIATPHNSHEALSIAAMEHGKHVLCEKPMGVTRTQVERMVASSVKNGVFLMEALWSRFNPSIQKVKELVENGKIGVIGHLRADFAFYALDRSEDGRLLNPNLAGGSLLDIGIYPAFLAYLMLGMPKKILSAANFYKTGVEMQTAMIFEYETCQALLYSGLNATSEMRAEIAGSKGTAYLHPRWHEAPGYSLAMDDVVEDILLPVTGKGYAHEIEEVHYCLRNGKIQSDLWSHQNSIDLITILDSVRNQNNIKFTFEK